MPTAAEEPLNCSFMEQLILESIARAVVLAVIVFANFLQVENAPRKNTAAFGCTNSDPLMKVRINVLELKELYPFLMPRLQLSLILLFL